MLSTFCPLASFSSIPNSSINAPLVPEPSSLETIVISDDVSKSALASVLASLPVESALESEFDPPHPVASPATIPTTAAIAINFFNFIFVISFCLVQ